MKYGSGSLLPIIFNASCVLIFYSLLSIKRFTGSLYAGQDFGDGWIRNGRGVEGFFSDFIAPTAFQSHRKGLLIRGEWE